MNPWKAFLDFMGWLGWQVAWGGAHGGLKAKYREGKEYKRVGFKPKYSRRRGDKQHARYNKWAAAHPKCRD